MTGGLPVIGEADRAGVEVFLTRLLRLSPSAVVRLRPEPGGGGRLWAWLPFQVLVNWTLTGWPESDATVDAAELRGALHDGDVLAVRRRDEAWRWPLPPAVDEVVETIPAADVIRLAAAASHTLRTALIEGVGGRAVGERAVRDALLDHVAVAVTTAAGERLEVRQRLVQAVVRMGLLGRPAGSIADTDRDGQVTVRRAMGWIGLSGMHGCAWYRPISPLRLS